MSGGLGRTDVMPVCAPCNNCWMTKLEDEALPQLMPMMPGRDCSYRRSCWRATAHKAASAGVRLRFRPESAKAAAAE